MAVTVSPEAHAHTFDALVAATLPAAARRIDAFAARVRSAHLEPEDLVDVAALERIPVLSKDELIELQAASPPFGARSRWLRLGRPRPQRVLVPPLTGGRYVRGRRPRARRVGRAGRGR